MAFILNNLLKDDQMRTKIQTDVEPEKIYKKKLIHEKKYPSFVFTTYIN